MPCWSQFHAGGTGGTGSNTTETLVTCLGSRLRASQQDVGQCLGRWLCHVWGQHGDAAWPRWEPPRSGGAQAAGAGPAEEKRDQEESSAEQQDGQRLCRATALGTAALGTRNCWCPALLRASLGAVKVAETPRVCSSAAAALQQGFSHISRRSAPRSPADAPTALPRPSAKNLPGSSGADQSKRVRVRDATSLLLQTPALLSRPTACQSGPGTALPA